VPKPISGIEPFNFETTINGKDVKLIILKSSNQSELCISTFG
jgi:aldose 1-epimerase